jgi:putative endonuclease
MTGGSKWHLYVVRVADGSLYTGIATDVERRLTEHVAGTGKGSKYLRGRGPLRIVYQRRIGSLGLALKVEHRVKQLVKREKERIVGSRLGTRRLLDMLALSDPDDA